MLIIVGTLIIFSASASYAATSNEGLWVRNWVGIGETQHWTDITDMLVGGGSTFTETDPIFESWMNSDYRNEQNSQWTSIGANTLWNTIQQNEINYLGYENTQQWHAIAEESVARQYHDQLLNNKINVVDYKSKMRDAWLNNKIDAETYQRMVSDQFIHNSSIHRDIILDKKIAEESAARQYYDQLLEGEISEVDYKSKVRDAWLDNRIDRETYERMIADKTIHNASVWRDAQLHGMIGAVDEASIQRDLALNDMIRDNRRRIDSNSDRIKDLEDPKFNVIGAIRFHDSKKWQIEAFAAYDVTNERLDRYGLEFVYKIGPSYEEKLIAELEARLAALEAKQ